MITDIRLNTTLPAHPKTKKLIRRLGQQAGWNLVCLFIWAGGNRPCGDLTGIAPEDLELAADWRGDEGALINELLAVGFLDSVDGGYRIHDWHEHNPWASGAKSRAAKARWNAIKRHHGEQEADRQVPQYAVVRNREGSDGFAASNAGSTAAALLDEQRSNAPSPSPSPYPYKAFATAHVHQDDARFSEFWSAYPVKRNKARANKIWIGERCRDHIREILANIELMKRLDTDWREGKAPHPDSYLSGQRWTDEPSDKTSRGRPRSTPESWDADGTAVSKSVGNT